jgi:hypothetical protein
MTTAEQAPVVERPQHLAALAIANDVRLRQADLKKRLGGATTDRGGPLHLDDVLSPHSPLDDADADALDRMRVADMLCAVRRCGTVVARKILAGDARTPPIPERKPVGRLTARQRAALAETVRYRLPWACSAPARRNVDYGDWA